MVEEQLAPRGITDPRVLAAMGAVPRHLFVESALADRAYEDRALPIGERQTISQPYIVALMSQALGLTGAERVLEVGTGSGYQAAILARLAARVFTVERVKGLLAKPLGPQEAVRAALLNNPAGQAEAKLLALETRKAWFAAVAARETANYMDQAKEAAEAGAELARRLGAAGNWSKLDQARERLFLAEATAQRARARQAALVSRERLARLMGLTGGKPAFELPERLPELPQAPRAADGAEAQGRSDARQAYDAYHAAFDLARRYRDEIVPLRKQISEEMLLRYNGMLASAFELLADARESIGAVNAYLEALRDFWIAESEFQMTMTGGAK